MSDADVTRLVAQLFVRSQAPGADVGGACAQHLGEGLPEARSLLDELGEVRTRAMALAAVGEQAATQAAGQTDAALVKRAVLDTMRRNVVALAGLLSAALVSGAVTAEQVSGLSMEVLRVPWPGAADAGAAGTGTAGGSASSGIAVRELKAEKAEKACGVLPKFGGSYKQHSGDASHADCDHDHGPDKPSKAQLTAAKHARTAAAKHARNAAKKAAAAAAKGGGTGGGDGVLASASAPASASASGSAGSGLWEGREEGGDEGKEKGKRRSNNVAKHVAKHVLKKHVMKKHVKVAVVGAGPHGLSVVAKLLEARVDPQEETPDNEVIFAKGRNGTTIRARHEHDPSAGVGTSNNNQLTPLNNLLTP